MEYGRHEAVVVCDCMSLDHVFRFTKFDDAPEVYLTVLLPRKSFWRRLCIAVAYTFGYQSRYGPTDEVVMGPSGIAKVKEFFKDV